MKKIYGFLKSQKTGIIVGFTVTGLLIIGSLIMNYLPEAYEGLSGEDITFFFNNPRANTHLVLYNVCCLCHVWDMYFLLYTGLYSQEGKSTYQQDSLVRGVDCTHWISLLRWWPIL